MGIDQFWAVIIRRLATGMGGKVCHMMVPSQFLSEMPYHFGCDSFV